VYAGVTDLLDGWLARRLKQQTVVGSVVDPMADKALMMSTTIALAIQGSMPPYLALIILGRDAGLGVAAIYYRWISLPPPKTFRRYWDFSLPSAEVRPTTISKYNTFFQLALIGATVALPMAPELGLAGASVFGLGLHDALRGMQWGVAATTVWSGLSYVYSKDAVRILTPEEGMAMEAEQKRERAAEQGKEQ
jgi:cardiolipin synthase